MFTDIIWDFDGTLFDTYPGMVHAFKLSLLEEGIQESESSILEYMKISMMEVYNHFHAKYNLRDDFMEKMRAREENSSMDMARPFPYAEEVCKRIAEGGRKNFILTHRGYSTHKILEKYKMESYFTEVLTKHSGFKRKPDPEGYLYLVEKYGMKKDSTIIVGDRELEILAARAAGVKVCLYNTNGIAYDSKPDFIINSLEEIEKVIG